MGSRFCGFDKQSSLMVGSGMVSRGEMALIIVQLGFQAHLVTGKYYSSIILVILFTTLSSPFLLKYFTKSFIQLKGLHPKNACMIEMIQAVLLFIKYCVVFQIFLSKKRALVFYSHLVDLDRPS